jgi:hypothetical protein
VLPIMDHSAEQLRPREIDLPIATARLACPIVVMAHLRVLLGDYPHTRAVRSGEVASDWVRLEFVEAKPLNAAFKRMVRGCEFEVSELSLATFLQAKEAGKPLALLPYAVMSRFQHPYPLAIRAPSRVVHPRTPSGPRARAPRWETLESLLGSAWLQSLKFWSRRQTRGGSMAQFKSKREPQTLEFAKHRDQNCKTGTNVLYLLLVSV